jgi:CRISPR-associated exonuclease Cas4
MFSEDDLLPLSALQHLLFCERQCALIHVEQLWAENRLTLEGRHLHQKAHDGPDETRDGVRIVRGLRLRSLRLGLSGQADVVEFHADGGAVDGPSTSPPSAEPPASVPPGRPFPVEYKRGRPKPNETDIVQLVAQAMCLEEMLRRPIPAGAIFYGRTRRRMPVEFTPELRAKVEQTAARLHELIDAGVTPKAVREPKCETCSLLHLCMPDAVSPSRSAEAYMLRSLRELGVSPDDGA